MVIIASDAADANRGTNIFIGCWVLTGFVFIVLVFRYTVKAWVSWMLPSISKPERVWGFEDIFYAIGYGFDIAHMAAIWLSHEHGLGRHFDFLSASERRLALKWDFISQPLAVSAAMFSRTGVILFLYSCFAQNRRSLRVVVIMCLVVQVAINLSTILQIVLQCGPHPYFVTNRLPYFRFMWDNLPADGSVKCQARTVQTTIGFVQGGFNTVIDFTLTYLSGFEIWQFLLRGNNSGHHLTLYGKFKRLDPRIRHQRLWQTILLCGPLLLSGIASIVKTDLLSALSNKSDFTWDIVPFILWVKIEDYSIPIATTGPILRLFIRCFTDQRGADNAYGPSGNSRRGLTKRGTGLELSYSSKSQIPAMLDDKGFVHMGVVDEISEHARNNSGSIAESEKELVGGIMVKQEYEVRVEEAEPRTRRTSYIV